MLHILKHSPFTHTELFKHCAAIIKPGDAIILLEEAVYLLTSVHTYFDRDAVIYVLQDDALARGIKVLEQRPNAVLINDQECVDLTIKHYPTCTW